MKALALTVVMVILGSLCNLNAQEDSTNTDNDNFRERYTHVYGGNKRRKTRTYFNITKEEQDKLRELLDHSFSEYKGIDSIRIFTIKKEVLLEAKGLQVKLGSIEKCIVQFETGQSNYNNVILNKGAFDDKTLKAISELGSGAVITFSEFIVINRSNQIRYPGFGIRIE